MKTTENKLRELIREELQSLNESKELSNAISKMTDTMLEYNHQIGNLEYAAYNDNIDEREFDKFKKEFDKIFDDYKKLAIKFGKKYNV